MNLSPEVFRWIVTNVMGTQAALLSSGLIGKRRLDYFIAEAEKDYDAKLTEQKNEASKKALEALDEVPFLSEMTKPFTPEHCPCPEPTPSPASAQES